MIPNISLKDYTHVQIKCVYKSRHFYILFVIIISIDRYLSNL